MSRTTRKYPLQWQGLSLRNQLLGGWLKQILWFWLVVEHLEYSRWPSLRGLRCLWTAQLCIWWLQPSKRIVPVNLELLKTFRIKWRNSFSRLTTTRICSTSFRTTATWRLQSSRPSFPNPTIRRPYSGTRAYLCLRWSPARWLQSSWVLSIYYHSTTSKG